MNTTTKLAEALELIAATDPIEAALDPQRAIRVAREALRLYDEATALPVQDERAAFEAWCKRIGFTTARNYEGDYLHGYGAELWSGWQARAAQAATPAAAPQALPLTWEQIKYEWRGFNEPTDNPVSLSDFEYVARAIERAHGIGANSGGAA